MSFSEPKPGQRPLAAALSLLLALSGCAQMNSTMGVVQQTTVNYYPKCYEPVGYLRESDQRMQQAVGTGVALGALGGAAIGAIATGDSRGAIAGAVLGGLAGGATAYYQQKQQQLAEDSARFAAYGTDIDRTTGEFNRTTSAARNAQRCYQKEFKALVQLRKRGKVSDSEGRARFAEIVSGMSEANALMAAVDGRIGESLDTYTKAYESDLQKRGATRSTVAQSANRGGGRGSSKSSGVPTEAVNVERKVQRATAAREEVKTVTASIAADTRSFCSSPDIGDWGKGNATCAKSA